jgi:hypothetical protein
MRFFWFAALNFLFSFCFLGSEAFAEPNCEPLGYQQWEVCDYHGDVKKLSHKVERINREYAAFLEQARDCIYFVPPYAGICIEQTDPTLEPKIKEVRLQPKASIRIVDNDWLKKQYKDPFILGVYEEEGTIIYISKRAMKRDYSTLAHEIAHAINDTSGLDDQYLDEKLAYFFDRNFEAINDVDQISK